MGSAGACSDVSAACSGEGFRRKRGPEFDGLRRLAGVALESPPAHRSPDFGPTRKSAISGDILEEIRKSGFRDLVRNSYEGVY